MMNEKTASKEDVTTAIVNIAKSASISDLRQFYIDRKCEDAEYQDNKELLELLHDWGPGSHYHEVVRPAMERIKSVAHDAFDDTDEDCIVSLVYDESFADADDDDEMPPLLGAHVSVWQWLDAEDFSKQ